MKILLMDGQALFCDGLRHMLSRFYGGKLQVLQAGSFEEGLRLAGQHPDTDLILFEPKLPGGKGAISIRLLRRSFPHIALLVVSGEERSWIAREMLNNNVSGFVSKSSGAETLLEAVERVLARQMPTPQVLWRRWSDGDDGGRGGHGLTPRQSDILQQILAGLSNKEIALMSGLAEGTVKSHVAAVFQILGIRRRAEAVQAAGRLGLLPGGHAQERYGLPASGLARVSAGQASPQRFISACPIPR